MAHRIPKLKDYHLDYTKYIPHQKYAVSESYLLRLINEAAQIDASELDLSNLGIQKIPERLKKLTSLKKLNLSQNQLIDFPIDILLAFPELEVLEIRHNHIEYLPSNVSYLEKLKHLDLSNNEIVHIHSNLFNLPLRILNLAYNEIYRFPTQIEYTAETLEAFSIRSNFVYEIPEELFECTKLKALDLSFNDLEHLSDKILQLPHLQWLNLEENHFADLPQNIHELQELKLLDLSDNPISMLTQNLLQFPQLQSLDVRNTAIREVSERYLQASPLKIFHWDGTSPIINQHKPLVQTQPKSRGVRSKADRLHQRTISWIEQTKKEGFTELNLSKFKLKELPLSLFDLDHLEYLNLSGNELAFLPFNILYMRSLKKLDLSFNNLRVLPKEIFQLPNLIDLSINGNKISTLPPYIGQLTRLQSLSASYNQLTHLPKEIGELKGLKYLHLHENKIVELPESMILLKELVAINLQRNPIAHDLPSFLQVLPHIKEIKYREFDNPTYFNKRRLYSEYLEEYLKKQRKS